MIGAFSISSCLLLIRSKKNAEFEYSLSSLGNYDALIYDTDYRAYEIFKGRPEFTAVGCYYQQGYMTAPDSDKKMFVAAFPDEISEEMYHIQCIKGRLPVNEDEIAVDRSELNNIGLSYSCKPGEIVSLDIYDETGELIGNKEYTLSGYFELSATETVGGWIRYPRNTEEEYDHMPSVIASPNGKPSQLITLFLQSDITNNDLFNLIDKIKADNGLEWFYLQNYSSRARSRINVLGLMDIDEFWDNYSMGDVDSAYDNGVYGKDFVSRILIPIFVVLIVIIAIITITNIYTNVYYERSDFYGSLRSIGLSSKGLMIYMASEMIVLSFVASTIGILLSCGMHLLIARIINAIYNLHYESALAMNKYVSAVTWNPYTTSLLIILFSVVVSIVLLIRRFGSSTPIEISNRQVNIKVHKRHRKTRMVRSWRALVGRNISFHSRSVMIIMIIVMATMIFGYCYFRASSEKAAGEYTWQLEEDGILKDWDYSIDANLMDAFDSGFGAENHHSYGIDQSTVDTLTNLESVEDTFYNIENKSTRLTYPKDTPSELLDDIFGDRKIQYQPESYYDDIINSKWQTAVDVMIEKSGYDPRDNIYLVSTFGLRKSEIDQLTIVAGQIDYDKMASGEEVIMIIPKNKNDAFMQMFKVGDKLPLSDLSLNADQDLTTFSTLDPDTAAYYEVATNSNGDQQLIWTCAYGYRYDIDTSIGAIAVITAEQREQWFNDYPYGGIVCLDNTEFASWGLPDSNYTKLQIRLSEAADQAQADKEIFQALSTSEGLLVNSRQRIYSHIYEENNKVMVVYYVIIILLLINGISSVIICLYTKVKLMSDRIVNLRLIGMSIKQIFISIVSQNLYYPFVGVCAGIIPTAILQAIFSYIDKMCNSGAWDEAEWLNDAWFIEQPYYLNLFGYSFIPLLLICITIGILLVVIGTLPQLSYIRKHKMIRE